MVALPYPESTYAISKRNSHLLYYKYCHQWKHIFAFNLGMWSSLKKQTRCMFFHQKPAITENIIEVLEIRIVGMIENVMGYIPTSFFN